MPHAKSAKVAKENSKGRNADDALKFRPFGYFDYIA
jgi:hypothetical protein